VAAAEFYGVRQISTKPTDERMDEKSKPFLDEVTELCLTWQPEAKVRRRFSRTTPHALAT